MKCVYVGSSPKGLAIPEADVEVHIYFYGAVAQLGERLPCKQEVVSSTLISSTNMREISLAPYICIEASLFGFKLFDSVLVFANKNVGLV